MDDEVESLLVEVRAGTQGFAQDIEVMRTCVDTTLTGGFERAGQVLERGLLSAIRRGSLGFDDLKRIALQVIDEIAMMAHAIVTDEELSAKIVESQDRVLERMAAVDHRALLLDFVQKAMNRVPVGV